MATWKKVIVSGSNAQLNSVTASFKGDGSGITGVTATFPTTAKTDLATTDQIYINDSVNKYITYANLITDLAGSGAGTSNLTTTDTGDSLALTSQISVTGVTASLSGNATTATTATNATNTAVTTTETGTGYYVTFVDNTTGNLAQRVDSGFTYNATTNGVTATSFTGSLSGTATAVPWTGITGTPSGIVSASSLASSTQGQISLSTNGVSVTTNLNSLQAADTPTFNSISANGTSFTLASGATTLNVGGASTNVVIPGNLAVNGTTTIINTTNIAVKDQFILLNSGSVTQTDGGIIVGNSATINTGEAFYWENNPTGTGRWAIASGIDASTASQTVTANSYMVSVTGSTLDPVLSTGPAYGGTNNAYGNMYINTSTSDIWIWA